MRAGTIVRTVTTTVFGAIALVLSYNADCSGFPERSCESLLGTTMPQVDLLHSLLWVVGAAAFGWFVFSTANRVKILVATLFGGVVGFWIGVGVTVLVLWWDATKRDPAVAGAGEGNIFILAFFALIGLITGLIIALVLAWRRWARTPDSPVGSGTGDTRVA